MAAVGESDHKEVPTYRRRSYGNNTIGPTPVVNNYTSVVDKKENVNEVPNVVTRVDNFMTQQVSYVCCYVMCFIMRNDV